MMAQDPQPMHWGAMDRFQAHFIVSADTAELPDIDMVARTVTSTRGRFGNKVATGVSWSGGRLADALNADTDLCSMVTKLGLRGSDIRIGPADGCVRMQGKWKSGLEFSITKDEYAVYDRIAGHIKSL